MYIVCTLYLPSGAPVETGELGSLVRDLPAPFLLLYDFNGRHALWGDCITMTLGVLLASLVEDEELVIFNSAEITLP